MKTRCRPRSGSTGNILIVTIVLTGVMGLVLVSYLTMISTQTKLTARSQTWNGSLPVAEAGVEEALAHLNKNGIGKPKLDQAGWSKHGSGVFYTKRDFGDGYYEVTIQTGARPIITSVGRRPAPLMLVKDEKKQVYISRTVQAQCRAVGRFTKAIVARDKVELNGKYINVDSYHSYETNGSTFNGTNWGLYDPAKRRDRADIATIEGLKDELSIKAAKVWGKVSTGPEGDLKTDKSCVVGSLAWHAAGKTGVEPGWSANDAVFDMPEVTSPYKGGQAPSGGMVVNEFGTNYYDYILGDDDYYLKDLEGKVYVSGNARIRVKDKIEFSADAKDDEGIEFAPTARLEIYMEGKETKLTGKKIKKKDLVTERMGFNAGGNTTNFFYYGLNKNEKVELKNMDEFTGIIYAPNAEVTLKAGTLKYYRFQANGAIHGKKIKLEKNANLHYDENIANLENEGFVIESWKEIPTPTVL